MNQIFLIILFSYIYIINCDITIIGPNDLSSQFNNKPIEMTFDKIGRSSYDFYTRGELLLDQEPSQIEACQPLKSLLPLEGNQFQENFRILVSKRGGCSFVQKARNAQKAGYSMIIIVNNMETSIKNVIMSDDGSGNDIYIPIAMISKDDGLKIINYLTNNKSDKVKIIVEINFIKKRDDFKTVDIKFFFSSSELKAYELFNSLTQYMDKFGKQINFTPIYVIHKAPYYIEENPIRIVNCVSKGKYCYFPKETTIIKDGQAIIMEDLRQKCLYDITKKSNNINDYFNYLKQFHSQCLIGSKTPKFNDNCAKDALKSLGLSVTNINSCIASSYNVKDLLSNLYIDNDNIILKNEYEEIIKYKLTTFPSIIINNKPLEGIIKESKIINEICHLVKEKPDFCSYMAGKGFKSGKKFLVYFLIGLLILVNIFIFFIFRKYIIQRINERIVQGGLDLDSRIKNVIGKYYSLNEVNNDYVRMKNNPSSSNDINNQKGKVVDISVEMT